jgi:hypothetical protein
MKMNIKSYIGAIIICIIGLTSCEDRLDLKPFDELETDVALVTPLDFENLMRGSYQRLLGGGYYGGEFFLRPDVMSNNLIVNQQGRQTNSELYRLQQNGENATWDIVSRASSASSSCNLLLANIDRLSDQDYADELRGEAMALRAFVHFDVARVLCHTPVNASGDNLGMYYKKDTDISVLPSRGTLSDLYANILNDLNTAIPMLPETSDVGRINKFVAQGLLSRILLYSGNYEGARDAAMTVMSVYDVTPRASFGSLWTNAYDASVLLKLPVVQADDIAIGTGYGQAVVGPEFVPDFGFFNMYGADDIRTAAYFETETVSGLSYNTVIKYKYGAFATLGVVDATLLRAGEVALNLAEAHANIPGSDAAALAALDLVRSQRYSGFVSGGETGAALMTAIKLERRLELAFEGHRAFDLKRWGDGFTRTDAGEFTDGTGTNPQAAFISLAAGDHRYLWPIPQFYINLNPNLEQNPGY